MNRSLRVTLERPTKKVMSSQTADMAELTLLNKILRDKLQDKITPFLRRSQRVMTFPTSIELFADEGKSSFLQS